MKVYILRHGETSWNKKHLFQGQTDTVLDEDGRRQAADCRKRVQELGLTFDLAYSSPLRRAMETVEIVSGFPREQIIPDPRLMEINFGAIDGTPFERDSTHCGLLFRDPPHYVPVEGGESLFEVEQRLASFYLDLARKKPARNILIGCHGGAMRLTLVWMKYLELGKIWEQGIGNCTIIEAVLDEEKAEAGLAKGGVDMASKMTSNMTSVKEQREALLSFCPYHVTRLYETQDRFGVQQVH